MLRLTVVTPERLFLEVDVLDVTVPGSLGEMEILPGHVAILSELSAGLVVYHTRTKEPIRFMIGEGFLQVDRDEVNLLCEQARFKEEIDKGYEERLVAELSAKAELALSDQKNLSIELRRSAARLSLLE